MKLLQNKLFVIIKFLYILIFFITNSYADIVKKIQVNGNERISKQTVIIFSEINVDEEINDDILNKALKNLYQTGYFELIDIELKSNEVLITVKENKIIQKIEVEGVKNKTILNEIIDIVKIQEKTSFVKEKIQNSKDQIINLLRSSGFYFAEIDTFVEENENKSVNVKYNIAIGERAKIEKINFIGNKKIKDGKLKNIIVSEETKFWKFITRNKYLDVERIKLDERLISNFYKNKGYYNAEVLSSFAQLSSSKNFILTFKIKPGLKYFFNNISFKIPDDYTSSNFDVFTKIFNELKGERYSLNSIEKIVKEINNIALIEEYQFINAKYKEEIVNNNEINIFITFEDTEKLYVDRINVFGNYITDEKVIRNSLIIDEGDPYNELLFQKSIANIKARNIFKSVNKEIINSEKNKDSRIINITVEEKPTGEIFAGVGAGTDGSSITAGIKENNYLGKGIGLSASALLSESNVRGLFKVDNPNFNNTDRAVSTTIESSTRDMMSKSGYKSTRSGFSLETTYEQYNDFFLSPSISTYYETIDTSSKASDSKKKQKGDYFETLFAYGLTVNKLNQNFQPSDGYRTSFHQTIPIYSTDDVTFRHSINMEKYITYADDLVFSANFFAEAVNSIDQDVRISKRVFLPSRKLRGFTPGKIGPQDGGEYIGGNYGSALNLTSDLPIFNESQHIDFNIFLDIANVWGVDYSTLLDDSKIRSATGVGFDWFTPIGPLTFSLAIPLLKEHTDETETLRFNIGTSF
tara:strand:- start:1112 stop:3367 length:2256 start_codon:yes stop_codon:yes gene_type:complete